MADWEARVNQLVKDWEVKFAEQVAKLPSQEAGAEALAFEEAGPLAVDTEVKELPPWINVDGSSMIWAYRILAAGQYESFGIVPATELHLWFYRSGANQVSPKPTYPYHKHAYTYVPEDVIEAFLTAPSMGKEFHRLILGNAWKNLDPFRTNQSNGGCLFPNRPLPPDA
jgi:hypothetical protein